MKRISIIIALLMLVPATSYARHSQRYRIRYSPSAFSYRNSGLIPGCIKYLPSAFSYRNSGLVYDRTRYTPHAFSYRNPGFVVDRHCGPALSCHCCNVPPCCCPPHTTSRRPIARRAAPPQHKISAQELRAIRETDGMHVIRQALKDRGFENVQVNYRMSKENQTVSVVFILRNEGLIIRYDNPELMTAMEAESPAKRMVIERHEQRCAALAETFSNGGGAVYCINAVDKEQMVAALDVCFEPIPEEEQEITGSTPLYAKE
jgi:hypothetical protein